MYERGEKNDDDDGKRNDERRALEKEGGRAETETAGAVNEGGEGGEAGVVEKSNGVVKRRACMTARRASRPSKRTH